MLKLLAEQIINLVLKRIKSLLEISNKNGREDETHACLKSLFYAVVFKKCVATKRRGSRTTTTDAEIMLIQTNTNEVIENAQFNLFHVLGHEKECEN